MATTKEFEDEPQSVEEAGALLGTAVIRYGTPESSTTAIPPPKGTHSSFKILHPVPSSELFVRLYSLRSLLRSAPTNVPLVAAPSLLAGVLMKLLGISNLLATQNSNTAVPGAQRRNATPPLWSTPIRRLWVDCVVLCHSLGDGLSGNARINLFGFLKHMIQLAALNPRTAKASGGTRIAALQVIAGLLQEPKLSKTLNSWALDIIALVQKALKSSGNGSPTFRIAAMDCACACAIAARRSFLKSKGILDDEDDEEEVIQDLANPQLLLLKGALEDKAIVEMVRLLRIAAQDKFPEIRTGATRLAALLAPLVIHTQIKSPKNPDAQAASPTAALEDTMTLAFRNLDDESPHVAAGWAEALARCMSTAMEYHSMVQSEKSSNRNVEVDHEEEDGRAGGGPAGKGGGRGPRKGVLSASTCSTLPKTLKYLVSMFVKVGGELSAPRAGGTFSTGGRGVRLGLSRTMIQLLRLQTTALKAVGEGKRISHKEAILTILSMTGVDMERQLHATSLEAVRGGDITTFQTPGMVKRETTTRSGGGPASVFGQAAATASPIFGQSSKVSHADGSLVTLAASRVLREGISELSSESIQVSILHELVHLAGKKQNSLKANQLQVVWTELSHLVSSLGKATSASLDELLDAAKTSLGHSDHGVRYETAVAVLAILAIFPSKATDFVVETIGSLEMQHAELMALASTQPVPDAPAAANQSAPTGRFARFRRPAAQTVTAVKDNSLKHQYSIHGLSLVVSMVVRELPSFSGGLPVLVLDKVISAAEVLTLTLFNDVVLNGNPAGSCTCARAGFMLIGSALTTGPEPMTKYLPSIFGLWQKVSTSGDRGKRFSSENEIVCFDAMLCSMVGFLRNCSELLLTVPDALSRTTLILEAILPLLFPQGRLGRVPNNPAVAARLDGAKASIMECFAWLPPGSYPMVADQVFSFASIQIQQSIQSDVTCSILKSLVSEEDVILDATNFSRVAHPGQTGGARDLETDIISLQAEAAHPMERESAMLFMNPLSRRRKNVRFIGSSVLGLLVHGCSDKKEAPTPLHAVGTWSMPISPLSSAKVRLADAAIQAYAATFSLKSGKEQEAALQVLESLIPPVYYQVSRAIGVSSALQEQDRRVKSKEDNAAIANIAAILLSCLKALPLEESNHNVTIGLGPTWMNKAKEVLVAILPTQSPVVRRAAAEGLAFLGTLGVKEDAHFLQSSVLHVLNEVSQGSQSQGRPVPPDIVASARAGAMLTLACMQRTAQRLEEQRDNRDKIRGSSRKPEAPAPVGGEEAIVTTEMMKRMLPAVTVHASGGFFGARTAALHGFGILFAYSNKLQTANLAAIDSHMLRKLVELVEDNFLSAWTAASSEYDHGTEVDKLSSEAAFCAVTLRLMTFLLPHLHQLQSVDVVVGMRFSRMASLLLEFAGCHPAVQLEAMAFFEVLTEHQHLLPPHGGGMKYNEHPILRCIPFLMSYLEPPLFSTHASLKATNGSILSSDLSLKGACRLINVLSTSKVLVAEWSNMKIVALLFATLDNAICRKNFAIETVHRSLAGPRESEFVYCRGESLETELIDVVRLLPFLERWLSRNSLPVLLRYLLLSRVLLVGGSNNPSSSDENSGKTVEGVMKAALARSFSDAAPVKIPVRWQVKSLAANIATIAISEIVTISRRDEKSLQESPEFNWTKAKQLCSSECALPGSTMPETKLVFHVGAIVTAACATATSTVDQVEMRDLQNCAVQMLVAILGCFGDVTDPAVDGANVLSEFIPQISSCIKNALTAPLEDSGESSNRLFLSGCESLRLFIEKGVSGDKAVLKRLIRPAVPRADELSFFRVTDMNGANKEETEQKSSDTLLRVAKICCTSVIPDEDSVLSVLLEPKREDLGAHAAGIALDGAAFLISSGLSLGGTARSSDEGKYDVASVGLLYDSIEKIDDTTKAVLASNWAQCAHISIVSFGKALLANSAEGEECERWLRRVVPLCFVGLKDALSLYDKGRSLHKVHWSVGVNAINIATNCVKAITSMSMNEQILALDASWNDEMSQVVSLLSDRVLLPALTGDHETNSPDDTALIISTCALLQTLSRDSSNVLQEGSSVLLALLRPLERLQNNQVRLHNPLSSPIIATCFESLGTVISTSQVPPGLVNALTSLVLSLSSQHLSSFASNTQAALQTLVKSCLQHSSSGKKEHVAVMRTMAEHRNWDCWSVAVLVTEHAVAIEPSLVSLQAGLLDFHALQNQKNVLSALHNVLQTERASSALLQRLACGVGAQVFYLLQTFGTFNVPKSSQSEAGFVCGHAMKISLLLHSILTKDSADDDEESFQLLTVLFQSFIAILRFNGLPNSPPPNPGMSDPALGRLCAQAITHFVKVAPIDFKKCIESMTEQDRAIMEFSVRAEMSGYSSAPAPSAKKKLSLKGFKK